AQPDLAVREIERWAGHPHFVEIMLVPYTRAPFGQPPYHPILAAAAKHGLPIVVHVNRAAGMGLLTPVGFASYFIEHHALYSLLRHAPDQPHLRGRLREIPDPQGRVCRR